MRVLVTGAAGLTGGEIVEQVTHAGHEVVALVRRADQRVGRAAEVVVGRCEDPETMTLLLRRTDVLVHVAGIHLGHGLAQLAELRTLRRVIVVSTMSVGSSHRSSAALYLANESALLGARPDSVILRPTMIYGSWRDRNVHHVVGFARRYGFLPVPTGSDRLIQPIHYRDLAAGCAALVDATVDGVIEAGGARPLTLRQAAREILAAVGRRARLAPIPIMAALVVARSIDALRGRGRFTEMVLRTQEDRVADNARFTANTGVHPRDLTTGIEEYLREMAR